MTKDGGIHHLDLCVTLTANVPGSVLKLFQCAPDNQMQVRVFLVSTYRKVPKFSDARKIYCNQLKIQEKRSNLWVFVKMVQME